MLPLFFILVSNHEVLLHADWSLGLSDELPECVEFPLQVLIFLFLKECFMGVMVSFSLKSFNLLKHLIEWCSLSTRPALRVAKINPRLWSPEVARPTSLTVAFWVWLIEVKSSLGLPFSPTWLLGPNISLRWRFTPQRWPIIAYVPRISPSWLGLVEREHSLINLGPQILEFILIVRHVTSCSVFVL